MKNVLITIAMLTAGSFAHADGFTCVADEAGLAIKVYNQTNPAKGTRNAAVMIVSDLNVNEGNKTIARFTEANGQLSSDALVYTGNVDLRFNDSARKGELIAGTKLGYVDTIQLYVDYTYTRAVSAGTELEALVRITKRDGSTIDLDAVCTRYLKN